MRCAGPGFLFRVLLWAVLAGALEWQLRRSAPPTPVLHPPTTAVSKETPTPTASRIVVEVGGVQSKGMFELLASAGGPVAAEDPALVSQAEPLSDGAQVHVPLTQCAIGSPVAIGTELQG